MRVMGISGGGEGDIGHDGAACIIEDERIIAAAEEERFIGIKHAPEMFPVNAISYCLKEAGVKLTDIDKIAYYLSPRILREEAKPHAIKAKFVDFMCDIGRRRYPGLFVKPSWELLRDLPIKMMRKYFNVDVESKMEYVEHHVAHAASAYLLSPFNHTMIMSLDGIGEVTPTLLAIGKDGEIEKVKEFRGPQYSLGKLYAAFTQYLGFKPLDGEQKVMALAAFGKPRYDFSDVVIITDKGFELNPSYFNFYDYHQRYSEHLVERFGPPSEGDLTQRHMDIAASLQRKLEEVTLHLLSILSEVSATRNLVLAGGVALNVLMNSRLLSSEYVGGIFIQPAANDAGCALGAAVKVCRDAGYRIEPMKHAYLGPSYADETIEKLLKLSKVKYERYENIEEIIVDKLLAGRVLGWFQGRLEWGPRALGNRSILVDPRDKGKKDLLNNYVKFREPFRPFAPSVLVEEIKKCFEEAYISPYMLLNFKVKEEMQWGFSAAMHVDNTARVQTVEEQVNPRYYRMIKKFFKETGVPGVLNTSFNVRGQPIIRIPEDAIRTFFSTGIDCLAIGPFFIEKNRN